MLRLTAGLLSIALASSGASAQQSYSAEQLVAKNLDARGGRQALAAIQSLQTEGRYLAPGDFELAYKGLQKRTPSGFASRNDLTVQGLTIVQAYDGDNGWKINPFAGRRDAERMSADEARSMADSGTIDGVLLSAAASKGVVSAAGMEDFDGTLAYKLKVVQPDGDEFVYLLDPDTFLEIKMVESRRIRGTLSVNSSEMGDYEKVAGVYFPMAVDSWSGDNSNQRSRLVIEKATANVDAPASLFVQPADGAKPAAAGPGDVPKPSDKPATDSKADQPATPPSPSKE
ncbi:MAG: hypothetical protein ABIN83_00480 [Sphingomicrobium sp.]